MKGRASTHAAGTSFVPRARNALPPPAAGFASNGNGMIAPEAFNGVAVAKAALALRVLELEREKARLEEASDVLAHDLREGLSTIALFADALELRLASDPDQDVGRDLIGIRAGLARLDSLIDAVLQSTDGAESERQRPVDVNLVLADAMANLEARIAATQASITWGPLPWTFGDPDALTRLFQNLLSNSLKAGDLRRPLQIRITSARAVTRWRFVISDNGAGIQPDLAKAFQRSNGEMPRRGCLGLAISKRIVNAHGGEIRVERNREAGTVTSFDLAAPW